MPLPAFADRGFPGIPNIASLLKLFQLWRLLESGLLSRSSSIIWYRTTHRWLDFHMEI
jgi:hypothetical protein